MKYIFLFFNRKQENIYFYQSICKHLLIYLHLIVIELLAWAPPPQQVIPNCPPGLEYLSQLDQVLVQQQVELFESLYRD